MKSLNIVVLGVTLASTSAFAGGGMTGGGGDKVRETFFKARLEAASLIAGLDLNAVRAQSGDKIALWLQDNLFNYGWDVRQSEHRFVSDDDQTTCAHTDYKPAAIIDLSYKSCQNIKTINDAVTLLLHESAHHLGITSEEAADGISYAITHSTARTTCTSKPNSKPSDTTLPLSVNIGGKAGSLVCSVSLLEGEDQHPLTMTYTLDNPKDSEAAIHYFAKRVNRYSGQVTESTNNYFPIKSLGFPKVENGTINSFASFTGQFDTSRIPVQYSMAKFVVVAPDSEKPMLKVSLFYARSTQGEDTYLPADAFPCQKP